MCMGVMIVSFGSPANRDDDQCRRPRFARRDARGVRLRSSQSQGHPSFGQSTSPFPSMDAPSIANILVSLDGEEIETGCELKGFALRRTYGNISMAFRRCGDFAD